MSAAPNRAPSALEASAQRRPAARSRLLAAAWTALCRLQMATWRVRDEGLDRLDRRLARGEGTFIVFWHGKYLPLFGLLRGRSACVFTSLSARGDVIVDLCHRFGYRAIRIPDGGRDQSLQIMRQALTRERAAATAIDGPLGPYHSVKRGPIQLASELGWAVVPVTVAARRRWVAEKRWDRMELPWLFTRIRLAAGEPIEVPGGLTPEAVEVWKGRVGQALDELDARVEASVASPPRRSPAGSP